MVIYQNDWVAEYHQTDDKVVNCRYVYGQDPDDAEQNDTILSYPYSEESSDIDEGSRWQDDVSNSINTFQTSKKKKRRSRYRYDEDNYALPDPETVDEVKIRTLEPKAKANKRQVGVWRATSFLLIGLLLISVTGNAYLVFEKVDVKGRVINANVTSYIQMNI